MYRRAALCLLCCLAGTLTIALSQEQSTIPKYSSVVVAIPAEGEFYLRKQRIAQADIPESLKELMKDRPLDEQIVYIKAADDVRYGTVVTVVNAIREVGIDRIGLVSNKKKEGSAELSPLKIKPAGDSSRVSDLTPASDQRMIVIEVMSPTRVKLNSKQLLLSNLGGQLKAMLDRRSDKTIFIRAPDKLSYGEVVGVIDIAKSVGGSPIGLQIDQ